MHSFWECQLECFQSHVSKYGEQVFMLIVNEDLKYPAFQ